MVVTTDVPDAIRQTIFENWKLHGSLSRKKLGGDRFNTGSTAPSRKYPSVEILQVTETPTVLTVDLWQQDALVHVHVWARPRTTSKKALAQAKNQRRYLVQEVKRILHLMCISIEDVEWAYPGVEIYADQYHALERDATERVESSAAASRGFFPILHTIIPISARKFHHKHTGGYAVNR